MKPVWIILTTYNRLDLATKTIEGLKQNLRYDNLGWIVTDDGSGPDYMQTLKEAIGPTYSLYTYDGQRKGVGHNMNWALHKVFGELDSDLILMMEDDWYLSNPLDLNPYVNLLEDPAFGMVRFEYAAAGLKAELISQENRLLWKLECNTNYQYNFTGHPSLRHKRFHETYGYYQEGLKAGFTELDMCGKFNAIDGPKIVIPYEYNQWGAFGHIGSISLADVEPGI